MAMGARTLMSISAHQIMAWLSPSFPTGGFAYSHGLEYAVHNGDLHSPDVLKDWLQTILIHGAGWNDALFLAASYRGEDVAELAAAQSIAAERYEETMAQGAAFARIASELLSEKISPAPLPVVVGQAARIADIPLEEILPLYLHSFASNLIHAGIRLIPIGQTDGQKILAQLFETFDEIAERAMRSDLDDLNSTSFLADIAAMKHETMTTRIFKS